MKNFNSREFRDTLGCFATGIAVVTTNNQEIPFGMTINSFSSVSLEPPLVLWCLSKETTSYDAFSKARYYNIHVLGESQQDLSKNFASADSGKFNAIKWHLDERGSPCIEDCKTTFHCEHEAQHEGGDHVILIGRVIDICEVSGEKPLIFAQGQYSKIENKL